jgi:hypothetical protein
MPKEWMKKQKDEDWNIKNKRQHTTMYKNNSGFSTKLKVSKYNKGLCLTEKLVHFNPLLFLY